MIDVLMTSDMAAPFQYNENFIGETFNFHDAGLEEKRDPIRAHTPSRKKTTGIDSISFLRFATLTAAGVVLQVIVGLGSYSGEGRPPMYGDYEAQRHWMEITLNLPANEWYKNTTKNDLLYWGLDYPPLTAYHSLAMGYVARYINPSWVKLGSSRGIETATHKVFMRLTAIISHLLVFAPALYYYLKNATGERVVPIIHQAVLFTFFPALMSVDHGHFQYNAVSLGMFLLSYTLLVKTNYTRGAIAFTLALNYKQMELYHSLPIFVFLLVRSISFTSIEGVRAISVGWTVAAVAKIGWSVILTFAVLWSAVVSPSSSSTTDTAATQNALAVIGRIFPFNRGLYEDKVANMWCAFSWLIKFNQFRREFLIQMSLITVLLTSLPSLIKLFFSPNHRNFRLTLFIVSLNFFLFSFQVHEKSILLPAIPALLLVPDYPALSLSFLQTANLSLYSLCVKDQNEVHIILFIAYSFYMGYLWIQFIKGSCIRVWVFIFRGVILVFLCACESLVRPPPEYPHLFPLAIAFFSCIFFLIDLIYANSLLILLPGVKPKTD